MKTTNIKLKLLTNHTPQTNFDAFPFGLHEYTPAAEIAMYYGFTPVKPFRSSDIEPEVKKALNDSSGPFVSNANNHHQFNFREKGELIKMYREDRIPSLPAPTMLYFEKPMVRVRGNGDSYRHRFSLECLGVHRSIAEALIIQTAYATLETEGFRNLIVELNSLGDSDSRQWFERALHQFIRSTLPLMPCEIQKKCRQNPYAIFSLSDPRMKKWRQEAPEPLSYLSESSRTHLSELLEYLEALNIPYVINNALMGPKDLQSQIIFRITDQSENVPKPIGSGFPKRELQTCLGMRYTPIGRKLGFRREVPAVGVQISYTSTFTYRRLRKRRIKPRFCFVHLGFEAKLKSLQVINILRKKRIPLYHCLTKDKLAPQISAADRLQLPYIIIMGQKEAMENTVLVRDIDRRSQEIVSVDELPQYLRHKR